MGVGSIHHLVTVPDLLNQLANRQRLREERPGVQLPNMVLLIGNEIVICEKFKVKIFTFQGPLRPFFFFFFFYFSK